jgi:hypothetical protein
MSTNTVRAKNKMNKPKPNNYFESVMEGGKAEATFESVAIKRGNKVTEADRKTNIHNHIDFFLENKAGTKSSVDVKGMKRVARGGERTEDIQWIEFLNVKGNKGWIMGDAELIAFEAVSCFYLFKRIDLLDFCTTKCSRERQNNPRSMPGRGMHRSNYTPYRRTASDRLDSIILAPMSDFVNCVPHLKWEK